MLCVREGCPALPGNAGILADCQLVETTGMITYVSHRGVTIWTPRRPCGGASALPQKGIGDENSKILRKNENSLQL